MLGCRGAISSLRRLASGPFRVEDAVEVSLLENPHSQREDIIISLENSLESYRRIEVSSEGLQAAINGAPLSEEMVDVEGIGIVEGEIVAVFGADKFLGMHRVTQASPFCSRALRMM